MKSLILVFVMVGMCRVSGKYVNKDQLIGDLKKLAMQLRRVDEQNPTAPEIDLPMDNPFADNPQENGRGGEWVKIRIIENVFAIISSGLIKRLNKIDDRFSKKVAKMTDVLNQVAEIPEMENDEKELRDLVKRYEEVVQKIRDVAKETKQYFDGAGDKIQNILGQLPSPKMSKTKQRKLRKMLGKQKNKQQKSRKMM